MDHNIKHLAIIMDGNQRWAKNNKKKIQDGYFAGFKKLEEILNYCIKSNITYVTVFALSTENLKRKTSGIIFKLIREIYLK